MKTTYIYGLYDPRYPEEMRYIGKADDTKKRLTQHIRGSKPLNFVRFKGEWIRFLIDDNIKPEVKILETVAYDNPIEWEDREVYYIAYYFNKGHRLENSTPGGSDNFHLAGIRYRHKMWKENKKPITKYKLDEAIMYTRSNRLDIESAWRKRRDFYTKRQEHIEADFSLRVASHDVNRSRFFKLGGKDCPSCGLSINEDKWNDNKLLFFNTYVPPEVYNRDGNKDIIADDDKHTSCDCYKEGLVFLKYNCRLYSRMKSFDNTRVLISDERFARELAYIQKRFEELMQRRKVTAGYNRQMKIRPLKILVVDDYDGRLVNAKRVLKNSGHKVETANGGICALDKLSKRTFDVILMGVTMSEIDGIETAKLIRESEKKNLTHTLIIAAVAPILETNKERFLSANFDGYIPIPIQVNSLHEEIFDICNKDDK